MGVLVVGARKVEKEVERLKTNLREITEETRAKAEPKFKRTLKEARGLIEGKESRLKPVRRRVEDVREHLSRNASVTLNKAKARGRVTLKRIIERAIDELEKAKRNLDRDSERMWHAS